MKKLITSAILVLALLVMTVGAAFAQESTAITGTVQAVALETDATTGVTTAVVTVINANGTSQTVRIDLQTAESLGLVSIDQSTGEATVTPDAVGKIVEINSSSIIGEDDNTNDDAGETQHPVGSALSDFFSNLLGVDYESIMAIHEDGVGFGVIAQALWLTNNIDGDTATFEALLKAKQSGDFSAIILADGTTPDHWGDVVKSLKKGNNLGSVMSGRAEQDETTPEAAGSVQDNGSANGNGNSQGNSGGNGNSNGHGNGGGNGQGNNGHP